MFVNYHMRLHLGYFADSKKRFETILSSRQSKYPGKKTSLNTKKKSSLIYLNFATIYSFISHDLVVDRLIEFSCLLINSRLFLHHHLLFYHLSPIKYFFVHKNKEKTEMHIANRRTKRDSISIADVKATSYTVCELHKITNKKKI